MKLNEDFLARMHQAAELLRTSGPAAATAAIQEALGNAGLAAGGTDVPGQFLDINPIAGKTAAPASAGLAERLRAWSAAGAALARQGLADVEDVEVHEQAGPSAREDGSTGSAGATASTAAPGKFLSGSCTNQAGTRAYRLYVPSSYGDQPLPLVVMLHGCKQNPADFAAGTDMNRLAEEQHCLVLYPQQAPRDNGSNCWNWFNPADQERDAGEPSILADMTKKVMREYRVDADRVYVAGLSAGGAMAAILAHAYPELYAAVAIHSGLPVGAAHDVASAFGAMKSAKPGKSGNADAGGRFVPAIVFHGDRDHTVHPDNGLHALSQCLGMPADAQAPGNRRIVKGRAEKGRSYTRTIFDGKGNPQDQDQDQAGIAEHWLIHGAGHAWAGGSKSGSYTDPKGPKASVEMMRFFYAHPNRSRAS